MQWPVRHSICSSRRAGGRRSARAWSAGSTSPNSATATATYVPNINTAGRYDIYVWFPAVTKGFATAPFTVSDADGSLSVNVNQSSTSGGWKLLAAGRNFAQVTNSFVRLSNQGQGGNNVVADAVRWVYAENQSSLPPPVVTTQPDSQTVIEDATVTFAVEASGTPPLHYQWPGVPLSPTHF